MGIRLLESIQSVLYYSHMAHPFEKIFEKALKKSSPEENHVLSIAERLREKGYAHDEILKVLSKLQNSLIDDDEAEIVQDAIDAFEIDL